MEVKIAESWKRVLNDEFYKPYFQKLVAFVKEEYASKTIYPKGSDIFKAFDMCPFESVKVVIVGQDPYHGPGQAHGLCFSVNEGIQKPPSLQNIFKELRTDLDIPVSSSGNLERWAQQGVLLLNTVLTVRAQSPTSHQGMGWEIFTDQVLTAISREKTNVVFVLWGTKAQKKETLLHNKNHLILKAAHPSPLSAYNGFFGSRPFSKTNHYLAKQGLSIIDW